MSLLTSALSNPAHSIRATAHYLDQPQVINRVNRFVSSWGVHGAFLAKAAYDLANAPEDKRKDVLIEDALVLGPTWATTVWGLRQLSEHAESKVNTDIKAFSMKQEYPALKGLLAKVERQSKLKWEEIFQIVTKVSKAKGKMDYEGYRVAKAGLHLGKIFPLPVEEEKAISKIMNGLIRLKLPTDKLIKGIPADPMFKFFMVGGAIVLAGLAGGLVADAVRGIHDKETKVAKIKEGIFQFIANIAMCAVGATVGMTVADTLIPETMLKAPSTALKLRGTRFGIILAGLSIGIVGGGFIANWMGRKFVNPFFEWMDRRHTGYTLGEALRNAKNKNDRDVELMDVVLHLDDLPTAFALAGMEIFKPFIPLFFAVSGYRTGIGYRSSKEDKPASTSSPAHPFVQMNSGAFPSRTMRLPQGFPTAGLPVQRRPEMNQALMAALYRAQQGQRAANQAI